MADREKWSEPLSCKQCGAVGNVTFSHDDRVVMTSETLEVNNVSGDFKLDALGRTPDETTFICLKCGATT